MKHHNILCQVFFGAIVFGITLQACTGMGSLRGDNVKLYYKNFDKMVEVSRDAVENKGYSVINMNHKRNANQSTTISFASRATAGQEMVNAMQSNIHLAEVDTADAVVVRIDNPDYNYGTPTDQRIDYAKVLFEEIDKLLD